MSAAGAMALEATDPGVRDFSVAVVDSQGMETPARPSRALHALEASLRDRLLSRRERLLASEPRTRRSRSVGRLLAEVDAALAAGLPLAETVGRANGLFAEHTPANSYAPVDDLALLVVRRTGD
jgi:hypothetical protein